MRDIPVDLQAVLAGDTLTLAWCARLDRQDGVSLGFTEHDDRLHIAGLYYEPSTGINLTAVASTAAMSVDNSDLKAFLDSAALTENDLLHGVYDNARLTVFLVDWSDVSKGVVVLATGLIGEISAGDVNFQAEFRSQTQRLQQSIGRRLSIECDADLGDSRCTQDLTSFTHSGTVTNVVQDRVSFTVDLGGAGSGDDFYFDYGTVDFTNPDGRNTQMRFRIREWTGDGTVVLSRQVPDTIQVDDPLTMIAGCDKKAATCKGKFNNFLNFQGFPHVPGRDAIMRRPSAK